MSELLQKIEVNNVELTEAKLLDSSNFQKTEIGQIPKDWELVELGDVSIISRLAGAEYTSVWRESPSGEIIALRGFNIEKNKINLRDVVRISDKLSRKLKRSRLTKGDVIYPCVGTIGNAAVIYEDDTYHIQQNIARITPDISRVMSEFLSHYLTSSFAEKEVEKFNATSSQPNVLVSSLRQYKVPLPKTLLEQTAIANTLSDVDALIQELEKLIAKKQAIKTATMQQLLTGRTRLPAFAYHPDGRRKDYKPSELGEIPEDWIIKKLGDVAPLQRGFDLPSTQRCDGQYPVVYSNGIVNTHNKYQVKGPGVVTGRSGTLGKVHYIEQDYWPHNTSLWVTRFNQSDPKFIFFLFSFIGFERFASGSGVPTLNRNDAHCFELLMPSTIDEQIAMSKILSDMDKEIEGLEGRLNKTRQIKQGMMQELLTGKTRLVQPINREAQHG